MLVTSTYLVGENAGPGADSACLEVHAATRNPTLPSMSLWTFRVVCTAQPHCLTLFLHSGLDSLP